MIKAKVVKPVSISMENGKIGKIPSFSLPAADSCPGKTEWCSKSCYALKLERIYKNVKASYALNFKVAQSSDFVSIMNSELLKLSNKGIKIFRWHISGDWFNVKYIYNWVKIVKANPNITFFGYTHSWAVPDLLPHIGVLRAQPNVVLFASVDKSTTKTPPKNWRIAYAGDVSNNPFNKMITCLEQTGKIKDCATCKLCFNKLSTVNIHFKVH